MKEVFSSNNQLAAPYEPAVNAFEQKMKIFQRSVSKLGPRRFQQVL